MLLPAFVTTSVNGAAERVETARGLALDLGVPFVPRGDMNEDALYETLGMCHDPYIVVEMRRIVLKGGRLGIPDFFFHPSMSALRVRNLAKGGSDHFLSAMGLGPGWSVLDCTLGLATDAIVAAHATGHEVTGLEASPVLAALVGYGLSNHVSGVPELDAAMRRVRVIAGDHSVLLPAFPDGSFDCVFFDPMFRNPKTGSAMAGMRALTEGAPVGISSITQAKRVARHRVVLKEARESGEFERLGFDRVVGGKYSEVAYGVWDKPGEVCG